jgi:beta-lactamase superfamily II metal-dependent hydrolase
VVDENKGGRKKRPREPSAQRKAVGTLPPAARVATPADSERARRLPRYTLGQGPASALKAEAKASHSGPRVSRPDEPLEVEAEAVAAQVVSDSGARPAHRISSAAADTRARAVMEEEEEEQTSEVREVQRQATGGAVEEEAEEEEGETNLQRHAEGDVSHASAGEAAGTAPGGLPNGGGLPLPDPVRSFFESRFSHDFSGVRVHSGPPAADSARSLNAAAYTVGADIVFAPGRYAPETSEGRRLLAHELTHVVQQEGGPEVQRQSLTPPTNQSISAEYARDFSDEDLLTAIRTLRAQGRVTAADETTRLGAAENLRVLEAEAQSRNFQVPDGVDQDAQNNLRDALARYGLLLSDEDLSSLIHLHPHGMGLEAVPLYLSGFGPGFAASAQVLSFRVTSPAPLEPGVTTYIMRVGAARSIVLTSDGGGPTVMLDAGRDIRGLAGVVEQSLSALLRVNLVTFPQRIMISHTDADHINEVSRLLRMSGAANTEIEIGLQQYRSAVGQADWRNANINVSPGQRVVEIDVLQGSGAHVRRRIIGNMQITEVRLPSAARTLAATGSRQAKNPTSPVTVVQDILTGQTQIFTADAPGRSLGEMIDSIGEGAFRALVGGGGRNLTFAEEPHHGGRVGPGGDARGFLRFKRLQFEASDGSVRFFTQTSERTATGPPASIRVLDAVGIPVEQVRDAPAGAAGTSVVRARGRALAEVTITGNTISQVVAIAAPTETEIMAGYRRLHELEQLRQRGESLRDALTSLPGRDGVVASLNQLLAEVAQSRASTRQAVNAYWQSLEAASTPPASGGLRAGIDTAAVTAAAGGIAQQLRQHPNLSREVESSLSAHENLSSLEALLLRNVFQMTEALGASRVQELEGLKAEQARLMGQAAAILGAREVRAHVRNAWRETRAVWTPRVMSTVTRRLGAVAAERHLAMNFRGALGESLSMQVRMHQLVERAGHGGGGAMNVRSRVGAGFLVLLELARIGMDIAENVHAGMEAEEAEAHNRQARGRNMVQWWLARGVAPRVALLDDDDEQVAADMSQEAIFQLLRGGHTGPLVAFDRVVVTEVSEEDRLRAVAHLSLSVASLNDWYSLMQDERYARHERGWTPFMKEGGRWYTLEWNLSDEEYQGDFSQEVHDRLEALYAQLRANQEARFEMEGGEVPRRGLRNVAWFGGSQRYVWVYDNGRMTRINLGEARPVFRVWGDAEGFIVDGSWETLVRVAAADAATYERLRRYQWPTGHTGVGRHGTTYYYRPNTEALAYVDPNHLEDAPAARPPGAR